MKDRIKAVRKSNDLTQQEFADRLGVPRSNIAGYESGARMPSDGIVSLICRSFNINEDWLRHGIGDPKKESTQRQKIAHFFADVLATCPDERSAFVAALDDLPHDFWPMVAELARNYADNLKKEED